MLNTDRWKFRNSSSTLQKRILPAPTGDSHQEIDEWMSQLYQGGTIRGSGLGPDLVDEASLRATPESRYDDFGREDFSVGLKGLRGCTSIVVLSKLGVYTSHFWEHAGFFKGYVCISLSNLTISTPSLKCHSESWLAEFGNIIGDWIFITRSLLMLRILLIFLFLRLY